MNVIKPLYVTGYSTYSRASLGTYFDRDKMLQTVSNDVQRINWNPLTGAFEGVLVEPARTNSLVQTNAAAYRLTLAQTVRFGTGYLTPLVPYTLSFYGTGTVTLSGVVATTVIGTGEWVRTVLTITPTAGTLTFTPSGDVLYAQFEQGAYPTSWIPTTTTSVTRAADIVGPPGMFQTSFPQPYPAYDALTTYATGDTVRVEARLYESLIDSNLGNDPVTSTAAWLDVGPTNQFACTDQKVSISSVGPGPLQTTALKLPGVANVVGLVGVIGTKVHIAINDQAGNIYTNSSEEITASVVLTAPSSGAIVSVCVENDAGDVVIGELLSGVYIALGETQYGHSFSITDYSRKDTDEFGTTIFVERAFAKRMNASVLVSKSNYNTAISTLEYLRAQPTVWVATDDPEYSAGAIVYGNCADFDLQIAYPTENLLDIEIQGLI